ncbi:hypothetical protein [Mesorhizobium sp. RIZ17]|uniref:hypothetical protein n=1 Tax=Mesorhizobium sp. RIZ17 TaxID=3132743 RepID=UPI003DA842F1
MDVLISEVAGRGRWTQFNLKLTWVQPFFGSPPAAMTLVRLCELNAAGVSVQNYNQPAVFKPNSRNWAFEIPGAHGLKYPVNKQTRPLLVIAQRPGGRSSFELLMPNDGRYPAVAAFLAAHRQTPLVHLSRTIVPRASLGAGRLGLQI